MTRTLTLLLLLLLGLTSVLSQDAPVCDFNCKNDSVCTECVGEPMLGDVELCRFEADGKGRHCGCEPGWSGLRCARKYESCYDNDHSCYNGGKCIAGLVDVYSNDQYFCDCDDAMDEDGKRFVGKYCELKAIATCDDEAHKFCVNGQQCSKDASTSDIDFCECGDDFEGPHCEFEKDKVPDCDLKCMNDGKCALGIKNYAQAVVGYNDFWANEEEFMHCECPNGHFGVRCEIAAQECGNHHCFNGATCVATSIDDGEDTYNCDCNSAHTVNDSFAGKYCQYQSNAFCEKHDTIEGIDFCVNGGNCKVGEPGCDCPTGFGGPMCEYDNTHDPDPDCDLSCDHGICKKGAKDVTFLENLGPDVAHLKDQQHDLNFEHCLCPQGYFGLTCDKEVELCGNGEHVCLNGSKCFSLDGKNWSCTCENADDKLKRYAGAYCQHEASVYCTPDSKPGVGVDWHAFCVNGGTCKDTENGNGHAGCDCPDKFEGENCELPVGVIENAIAAAISDRPTSTTTEGIMIFLAVFVSVVAVLSVAIYIRIRYRQRDAKEKDFAMRDAAMYSSNPTHSTVHSVDDPNSPPVLDFGLERDQEGTELENVEII